MALDMDDVKTIPPDELAQLFSDGGVDRVHVVPCSQESLRRHYGKRGYNLVKNTTMYMICVDTFDGLFAYRSFVYRNRYPRLFRGVKGAEETGQVLQKLMNND